MSVALSVAPPAGAGAESEGPAAVLLGSDRLELPRPVGLAALARLERLGRPTGPVLSTGEREKRLAYLLTPGTAELVPGLLGWLGWGPELAPELRAHAGRDLSAPQRSAGRCQGSLALSRPRGAGGVPPRPASASAAARATTDRETTDGPPGWTVRWIRATPAAGPPLGLDLSAPDLLRLLDAAAEACLRHRMGLTPAR